MSLQPIKTALKYLSAWSIVFGFVALLTIIFSFLGTLFCAAVGGMMMGATKASRVLSAFYSVFCPGVLLTVMRTQKTELPAREIIVLAVICHLAFWALYLMSALLVAYEKKDSAEGLAGGVTSAKASQNGKADRMLLPTADVPLFESASTAARSTTPELHLETLDGNWYCETCVTNGHKQKRMLEIKDGALVLSNLDAQGRICSSVRGRLKLVEPAADCTLSISGIAEVPAKPSENPEVNCNLLIV